MDSSEATKVVIDRISSLEPEQVGKKIIGYMYFQDISDQEMIRLALGPNSLIHELIQKAKNARLLASSQVVSAPMNPLPLSDASFQFPPFPSVSPRPFRRVDHQLTVEMPTLQNFPLKLLPNSDCIGLEDPLDNVKPSSFRNDYCGLETSFNNMSIKGSTNPYGLMEYPVKTCHYFIKGFCKHGSGCRYFHGESFPETYSHVPSPNSYDAVGDDQLFSPGSLEKLELEIIELLKSRKGNPVSIASLPMLYYEKYGKTLQAEGYLTESQRHGKAGFSLTKLLARLKNSICLIDRPHGQHAVILVEHSTKYMNLHSERNDPGPIVNGSRQIYMTFPAESTFTEEDVYNYFSNFGPVQDVRIPCQQKRMFGFVTSVNADTVKLILYKGNPHYVCGSRVLVKPYREKTKLVERKYFEKLDHPVFFQLHPSTDIDSQLQTGLNSLRLFPRNIIEEQENTVEFESTHFSQLQLAGRPITSQLDYSMDKLKIPEGHPILPSKEHFNYLFDDLNSGYTSDDNPKYPVNNCGDHESTTQGGNVPDSHLASVVAR